MLGKIHKKTSNKLPPFCCIFSATGRPIHKLAKFLLQFLKLLTANKYTVISSVYFTDEICPQDSNLHKTSLVFDSLFTNINLDDVIDICTDNLYNHKDNGINIPKHNFCNLLNIATK